MQKRYLPITIVTGILFLVALGGYLIPANSNDMPVRVLLENKGGKVILNHAGHVNTMSQECAACHHTTGNNTNPPACTDCHAGKFDEIFVADHQKKLDEKLCISCHHPSATIAKFSHENHETEYVEDDCQACHHDESIEPEPQACSNCHLDGSNSVPKLQDANHTRCADCHDDMYQDGIKGCDNCHLRKTTPKETLTTVACSSCHKTPVDQLIPNSMNAFHTQCMGCHREMGAGPYEDDACYQCHMK